VGSRRDADGPGIANTDELGFEISVTIEDLNAMVVPIRDIHQAFGIYSDGMRRMELSRPSSTGSPGLDIFSILIELRNPRIVITISDKEISI